MRTFRAIRGFSFLAPSAALNERNRPAWMAICAFFCCFPTMASTAPVLAARLPESHPVTAGSAETSADSNWITYHRDDRRTGYVPGMPAPERLSVAWKTPLDGAVYAEPLVVDDRVLVATENDSIYALDARTGRIEWHTRVGVPVPRSALPCGNIDPLGITGTPVYDRATGLIFAVAEIKGPSHILVGLDVRTGKIQIRRSADPPDMKPAPHQQRAALALSHGHVYIAYGGLFGDCGDYHGRVVASRTDGTGPLLSYQVPTAREGGIWAPPGPALDAAGRLYVSVGNGSAVTGKWDHSDSILRLSPTLKLEDAFAPKRWPEDNRSDADLGSLGPVLLPDGLIFIAGKSGIGYLLRADALGGVGGELLDKRTCQAFGGAATVGSTVFLPCIEGLQQVEIGPGASFKLGWRNEQVAGSPVVGGHTVYAIGHSRTLHALDAQTGKIIASIDVGPTSRFVTPTLYRDHVFIGTLHGVTAVTGNLRKKNE